MRKGFTLLELLIASSIFAIVMLITTATFTWASSYNNKLGEMRKTSLAARKIMEMLSQDIRMANGDIVLRKSGVTYVSGEVIILSCSGNSTNSCVPNTDLQAVPNIDISSSDFSVNNAILIIQEDRSKITFYRYLPNGDFRRTEIDYDNFIVMNGLNIRQGLPLDPGLGENVNINSLGTDVTIQFAGFTPKAENSTRTQQPFVKIRLVAQSENYEELASAFRSRIELQTSVTTRFYNIDK